MNRYLVVKPWKRFSIVNDVDSAVSICDNENLNNALGAYVVELTDDQYHYFNATKRFNLDNSPVIYDPKQCAPSQQQKQFFDNAIFVKPLKKL